MKKPFPRWVLYAALVVLYLVHNDLWFWHDAQQVLGLPVGLLYHIGFCLAAAVLMFLLVTYAWPRHLEIQEKEEKESGP